MRCDRAKLRHCGGLACLAVVGVLFLSLTLPADGRGDAKGVAPAGRKPSPPDHAPAATAPSPFGILTSRRWAVGQSYVRENLAPVENPNPKPEWQPHREHPFDLAISHDGKKVYIGLAGSEREPGSQLAVYDVAAGRVTGRIVLRRPAQQGPAGSSPYRLTMHPAGRYLLVTNRFSNFLSVVDTRTDSVVDEVPADFYCQGVAFSPDGKRAYVANRYLDQVFVVDVDTARGGGEAEAAPGGDGPWRAAMRVIGGVDRRAFFGNGRKTSTERPAARASGASSDRSRDPLGGDRPRGIHQILVSRCGAGGCHDTPRGGLLASNDARESFLTTLEHVRPGDPKRSRLLRAVTRTRDGGYADARPKFRSHAGGTVVFRDPAHDADYRAIADWIRAAGVGPGIPVGNPRSKPKICALTTDGRYLLVGNTGTQDISIVDTEHLREVGAIYIQNVVNDLAVYRSGETGHDYLLVTTLGVGFGVARERDPYGGETWDRGNRAAQFSVWRDPETARVLPRDQQEVLGPFDAVDGTAAIKFRDIQNDLIVIDLDALPIPDAPPGGHLEHLLLANRYETHRQWVRYTSDTAESTYGDIKGDIPPDLMRVVGAFPEKLAIAGDQVFVSMQGSDQVQQLRIDPTADEPSDMLVPIAVYPTGLQPIGIAAGAPGTPAAGQVFVANFLGGTLTVIDTASRTSREVVIDPSVETLPVPATNAERGEIFAHTALFSSDGDTSCFHCHYLDTGDGRPWGVSQVVGQEFITEGAPGQLVIGGTMTLPQMRGLFAIQPFFLEGVISAFEPRSMIMEHAPADDFARPTPQGDFTRIAAHYVLKATADIQSGMSTSTHTRATLEERRDAMFRRNSMRLFGKAFTLRDFQRFVGEWQIHEPRLLPNPFDATNRSVLRGKAIFEDPVVGCAVCHPPPHFTKKDFPDNPQQAFEPVTTLTVRDGAFTLIGMNRLDYLNGVRRDLEPWDIGRAEMQQGHFTTLGLRGIWDRPPVFLHHGMARTLREVVATPGHPALGTFRYQPRIGGVAERPGCKEIGFNTTFIMKTPSPRVKLHRRSGARIGVDTHGGTSHLREQQIDDLVHYLNSIE